MKSNTVSVILIIIVMLIVMCIIKPNYLSGENIFTLLKVLSVTTLVGVSQMISMASGGMNVAIGATGALSGIGISYLMQYAGLPPLAGFLVGLGIGALCGLLNGLLIHRNGGVGVAAFLVTLAMSSVFTGITLIITKGKGISKIPSDFIAIGNSEIAGIPSSTIIMLLVVVIFYLLFRYLRIGRQILAFGANWKAAELYGVSKLKVVVIANVLAGMVAALAGLLVVMRVGTAQPDIGNDWMLMSFAAPLIGGTKQEGGKVNVFGVILGGMVLTLIANALIHLKVDVYWTQLINGITILAIMGLDRIQSRKR